MRKLSIYFVIGILFCIGLPSVFAYQVSQPLDIQVTVQYDNGTALSNVLVPACIGSIYFIDNNSLVLSDVNLSVSPMYHNYSFTPTVIGKYASSIECSYAGVSATYFEEFNVETPTNNPLATGGAVLSFNAEIKPEKTFYLVNLQAVDTRLSVPVSYYVDGVLSNSREASWAIMKDGKVLNRGLFKIESTGKYIFDFDFKDYVTGDYKLYLYFSSKETNVDVRVVSQNEDLNSITGMFIDNKGAVSPVKAGLSIFIILMIVLIVVLYMRQKNGGKRR